MKGREQSASYFASVCTGFASVCTGSLVLAAAGLLQGYKATTHWRSLTLLLKFGIEVDKSRVVIDRNRTPGGGVTAGIDFGLTLTSLLGGKEMAKCVQLQLEYNPAPLSIPDLPR